MGFIGIHLGKNMEEKRTNNHRSNCEVGLNVKIVRKHAKFNSLGVRIWSTYINGTTPTSGETGVYDIDAFPTNEIMMSSKTVTPDFPKP